ncbi:MAG: sulfotransferase domain-containing protein [Phycisphaerales bacterium]|nr:sulfotransferase domain-containing protein [Phycisphaerales bacterium]
MSPDFMIIGAAKSGTTSLANDLARHQGIFITDPKEPEFFCRDENYARGLAWYESLYDSAKPDQIKGEASPHYTDYPAMPHTAPRLAQAYPELKMVYIVRDPVERAYSGWLQKLKNQDRWGGDLDVPRQFSEAIRSYRPLIDMGDYKLQISRILEYFPREQLRVYLFEDYVSDRAVMIRDLALFLGVDPGPLLEFDAKQSNASADHFETKAKNRMVNRIKQIPGVEAAKELVPEKLRKGAVQAFFQSPLGKRAVQQAEPDPMSDEDRAYLVDHYRDAVSWLEGYMGRSLSNWAGDSA